MIDERLIELLERYAAARPVDPMPHQNLARLYLDSDEPWRAIPHLEFLDARELLCGVRLVSLACTPRGNREKAFEYATRATRRAFDATNREIAAAASIQAGELRGRTPHPRGDRDRAGPRATPPPPRRRASDRRASRPDFGELIAALKGRRTAGCVAESDGSESSISR